MTPTKSNSEISLSFRHATAADRPRLIELINSAFSVETFFDGTRTDEERLSAMMKKGEIIVAQDDTDRVLASVFTELRGSRGYMGMLAVDPVHQGLGLGRRIVRAAEDRLRERGREAVDITVLNLRPELLQIYRPMGFVETGTQEFVPSTPLKPGVVCHCIVMSKQL
jgi:ribosomal protein S18 acetylase RimI-like enzyme